MTQEDTQGNVQSLEERRRKAALAMQTPEQRKRELEREKQQITLREKETQEAQRGRELEAAQKKREEETQILKIAEDREQKNRELSHLKKTQQKEEQLMAQKRTNLGIKSIRTFKDDLAESQKSTTPSWASGTPHEERHNDSKNRYVAEVEQSHRRGWLVWVIVIGIALIILAAGVGYTYFSDGGVIMTIKEPSAPAPIISTEQTYAIDLTGKSASEVRELLISELVTKAQKDGLTRSYFTSRATSTSTPELLDTNVWMRRAGLTPPGLLERSLDNTFDYGAYARVPNSAYLVLKTRAPQNAFSGMLQWEDTTLAADIIPLISGSTIDPALLSDNFEDRVVPGLNIDTRILRDTTGAIRLMYSVLSAQGVIVITKDENTLGELYRRLIVPAP